jgi:hypothetical protein
MSYRPNYLESWRPPPQQRDSWRPSGEQPNPGPDRRWNGTHVRYDEGDRPLGERRILSTNGDSWRPNLHEGHILTKREEDRDRREQDYGNRISYYSPRDRSTVPVKQPFVEDRQSRSNFNPSTPAFQPGSLHQGSSIADANPAPLRSAQSHAPHPVYRVDKYYRPAKSSGIASSRNVWNSPNVFTPGTLHSNRYSLRLRQSKGTPVRASDSASSQVGQFEQTSPRDRVSPADIFEVLQRQHRKKQPTPRRVSPPPAPTATDVYLAQARLPVTRCDAPKRLLVVLDLNGTLLVRPNRARSREFIVRPGVCQLLDYLFDNHVVMVYSSARPANVEAMVDVLVSKKRANAFTAIWGRDKLDLTRAQYDEKVQVYKKLEKIWEDKLIQATCPQQQRWSQANTVLVDDNHLKALSQPHNLIQVSEFAKKQKLSKGEYRRELEVVASIRAKLEELKWANDVSRLVLRWQTGEIEPPRATTLSPLPKSAGGKDSEEPSQTAQYHVSLDIVKSPDVDNVQAALQRDMENLTTDSSERDGGVRLDEPAISAEEWREFLK